MRSFVIAQVRVDAIENLSEAEQSISRVEMVHADPAEFYRNHARSIEMFAKLEDISPYAPTYVRELVHLFRHRTDASKLAAFVKVLKDPVVTKYVSRDQFSCLRTLLNYDHDKDKVTVMEDLMAGSYDRDLILLDRTIDDIMVHFLEFSYGDPSYSGLKFFNLRNMMIFFYGKPVIRAEMNIMDYVSGQRITKLGYHMFDPSKVLILKCDPIKDPV